MEELEFRKLAVSDRENFIECFNSYYGEGAMSVEEFDWQYVKNPAGVLHGFSAYKDDRLVGIYVVAPVYFQIDGEKILAAQSMDTLILPEVQGRGLFTKLCRRTYDDSSQNGIIKFTYGFPNQNSFPGFKKIGWTILDPLPFLFRLLKTSYITRKIGIAGKLAFDIPRVGRFDLSKFGFKAQLIDGVPADINDLWNSFRKFYKCGLYRGEEYLRWRFEQKPNTDYQFYEVRNSSGKLKAFSVMRIVEKHDGKLGYIMEFMTDDDYENTCRSMIDLIFSIANEQDVEVVLGWLMPDHPYHKVIRSAGFHSIPERFWPVELHFGFITHSPGFDDVLGDRANWYLSYADNDST